MLLSQVAFAVYRYAVFFSSVAVFLALFLALRTRCPLMCPSYLHSSQQYLTSLLVVVKVLPQFSQTASRLRFPSLPIGRTSFCISDCKIASFLAENIRSGGGEESVHRILQHCLISVPAWIDGRTDKISPAVCKLTAGEWFYSTVKLTISEKTFLCSSNDSFTFSFLNIASVPPEVSRRRHSIISSVKLS